MKWLLFVAIFLVALVVLVILVGLMLPKAHRASRVAAFQQSPEAIFAAITGPQDWRPGITVVDPSAPGGPRRWREDTSHGSITFEQTVFDPPRLYGSQIVDENLPFGGTWTWEITPTSDGCTLRITEDGEVYNPIFRFVSRFIIGHTSTIDAYLTALGKKFGEAVRIEN
jgi:hypothetical protein